MRKTSNNYISDKGIILFYEYLLRIGKIAEDGVAYHRMIKLKKKYTNERILKSKYYLKHNRDPFDVIKE